MPSAARRRGPDGLRSIGDCHRLDPFRQRLAALPPSLEGKETKVGPILRLRSRSCSRSRDPSGRHARVAIYSAGFRRHGGFNRFSPAWKRQISLAARSRNLAPRHSHRSFHGSESKAMPGLARSRTVASSSSHLKYTTGDSPVDICSITWSESVVSPSGHTSRAQWSLAKICLSPRAV